MFLLLACPNCADAYGRETRSYREPQACGDCDALPLLDWKIQPHLVLKCREYGNVFEAFAGQPAPGMRPVCPQCRKAPGREIELVAN